MPYERSRRIEQRFQKAVELIKKHGMNAVQLALELDVSVPTVHRIIGELKLRGYTIRSIRDEQGWKYEILDK